MSLDDAGAWTIPGVLDARTELDITTRAAELESAEAMSTAEWYASAPTQQEAARAQPTTTDVTNLSRIVLARLAPVDRVQLTPDEDSKEVDDVEAIRIPLSTLSEESFIEMLEEHRKRS